MRKISSLFRTLRQLIVPVAIVGVLLAGPASARCVGSSDPLIHRMEREIGRDPAAAIALIDTEIARTDPANRRRLAELYLAKSQALYMSGSSEDAALDKVRSIRGAFDPAGNIGLYLRISDAVEKTGPEMANALKAIAPDVEALREGSRARTCRATDLAYYNATVEQSRDAMIFGAEAYRNSAVHAKSVERAKAASVLGILVSLGHDFDYATDLHTQAYAIQQELGLSDLVANEVLLRGYTHLDSGNWKRALEDFEASAREARSYGNQYAVDYALLGVCEAALEGQLIERAAPACERARKGLDVPGTGASFPTGTLMARLLVEQGKPAESLRLLDPLVADGKASVTSEFWVMAQETRAQALSQLGRHAQAYAALREAHADAEDFYDRELQSGVAALQARFQTGELQRRLAAEERASSARLRLAIAVILGALTTLVLLGALVFVLLRHRRRFRRLAMTDPLTGLSNRRATLKKAHEALRVVGQKAPRAAFALIDIDHFKSCNDTFGHDAGDQVLSGFARMLERVVRSGDIVGRWGGEEFLLIFPATTAAEGARIIEDIRAHAEWESFDFAPDYRLQFSAGIAQFDEAGNDADDCIRLADKRLYAAKDAGRNRTCAYGFEEEFDGGPKPGAGAGSDTPVDPAIAA